MKSSAKMMMSGVSASLCLVVIIGVGVLLWLNKDKLFGGGGKGPGPTKDGPYAPGKYHKYVCPVVMDGTTVKGYSTWGTGEAKDKCCMYSKTKEASSVDNSRASNCTVTPLKIDKVTLFNWTNFEGPPNETFAYDIGYHYDSEGKSQNGETRPWFDTASMYVPPNHEVVIWSKQGYKDGKNDVNGTSSLPIRDDMPNFDSTPAQGGGTFNFTDTVEAIDIKKL